jgi:hypothetical protein
MEHDIITVTVGEILDLLAAACGGYSQYTIQAIEVAMAGHLSQGKLVGAVYTAARVKEAIIELERERWGDCPEASGWIEKLDGLNIVDQYDKK